VKRDGAAAVKRLRDLADWYRGGPAEAEESAERQSDKEELRATASKTGAP